MKKVLFIGMHRKDRSPSQRFRFEQYFTYLVSNGIECELSYLISEHDDKVIYSIGNYFGKLQIFLRSWIRRLKDVKRANKFDYIFIQREAFMLGSTFFERQLGKLKPSLIFDYDDAIWLDDASSHHGILGRLKKPAKTAKIIALADKVIAGNTYLAAYGGQFNDNVQVIPTTIDTAWYKPSDKSKISSTPIIIGWSGSFTTLKHFEEIIPILIKLKQKYQDRVGFKIIGDADFVNEELGIRGLKWQAETEIEDLQKFDIGIMPLPDNEWTRGKCGLKGLQYMGLAIPTIMSSVGVNRDIIEDGVNGFLAETDEEWLDKLSQLIESAELRKRLGKAGRETVVEHYSVEANKEKYLRLFE